MTTFKRAPQVAPFAEKIKNATEVRVLGEVELWKGEGRSDLYHAFGRDCGGSRENRPPPLCHELMTVGEASRESHLCPRVMGALVGGVLAVQDGAGGPVRWAGAGRNMALAGPWRDIVPA